MMTNNMASGNEMIDIEENHLDNEIDKNVDEHKINNVTRDNMIVRHDSYGDVNGCDNSSSNVHKDNNTSNNVEDSSIINDDNSINNNEQMYPSDCYSFLSLYGPIKTPVYFVFGLVICLFQLAFLLLFVLSVLHRNFSSKGDVDNPDDGLLAQFIYADADPLVRATQVLAIISYSLFAESSLQDVVTAVETFPRFDTANNDDKTRRVIFSCLLRFIQGGMAIFSSFILIVNSSNVIEIILNFTAVNFISNIDDVAFELARCGKYGSKLEEGAKSIENHPLPKCMSRSTKNRRFCYTITFTLLLMLAFMFAIMYAQVSDDFWRTTTFRVEFDKGTGLDAYTGCYKLDEAQSSGLLEKKRKIYTNSKEAVQFGYCRRDHRWFMYKGISTNPCFAGEDKLAQSVKTQSFDISTSYGDTWTSVSGSPLDLYFINLNLNNKTLADQCELFENGICDHDFNTMVSRYDGGDCCAATCSEPFCGAGNLTKAFGVDVNISGNGFPDCKDPSMVPITIHVQNFVNSIEPQYINIDFLDKEWDIIKLDHGKELREDLVQLFGDLEGIRSNIDEFVTWMNNHEPLGGSVSVDLSKEDLSFIFSDPKAPVLSLYCDQKNVISIRMDKSMEGNYETVMVKDGAECTLEIENTTTWEESIWYFNYTIYHDPAMQVLIDKGFSFEEGTKQFMRIRDCFLDTIFGYVYDFQHINYSDLTRKFNWNVEHDAGNQPCSSDFSIERYALNVMNMALINLTSNVSDDSELWMNDDMHCMWQSVECSQGFVVELDLTKAKGLGRGESGFILPTEIGILTNLQKLNLYDTGLIGTIPTEFGLLTELTSLILNNNNELTGSIPTEFGLLTQLTELRLYGIQLTSSIPTEFGLLTQLTELQLYRMELTSSIPTEVGLLTELTSLILNNNNELTGSIPTEFGLLTQLTELQLYRMELTSSIPTEFGLLTQLTELQLYGIELTSSIPTEFGLLTQLTELQLYENELTGSIPTEFGSLTELATLDLYENKLTGLIPTEFGSLTELATLDLYENELTGPIPTEVGLFTKLTELRFDGNKLTGSIPTEVGNMALLEMLALNNNKFEGSIPSELGLATNLWILVLGGNSIISTVPIEVSQLPCEYFMIVWDDDDDDLLQNETEIEVSDDYYIHNNSSDFPENEIIIELSNGEYNYNAVSDLSENATEIEI